MKQITVKFDNQDFIVYDNSPGWINHRQDDEYQHRFGGGLEPIFTDCLVAMLRQNPTWRFIDIGANFGAYSVIAAKRTAGYVWAFEPHPMNLEVLLENTRHYQNVDVRGIALGDGSENGASLLEIANQPGAHYVRADETLHTIPIEVAMLDSFGINCNIIKMDVEGYGYEVFQGGIQTFRKASVVMIEFHDRLERGLRKTNEDKLFDAMRNIGFNLSFINTTGIYDMHEWTRILGFIATKDGVNANIILDGYGGGKQA